MTDKRFKMGESDIQGEMMFTDTQTNKIYWQEYFDEIVDLVNEQQARIEMLEKGILDCLFNNKSVGVLAEEMRLVE